MPIRTAAWNRDLLSKVREGLLPAVVLYLLIMQIVLPLKLIRVAFGEPGLLVYTFGLLAVGMFGLQHALETRHSETTRAWYGIAAGILSWSVVQIINLTAGSSLVNSPGVVLFILVSLTVSLFWRLYTPIGARFFFSVFLGNWFGSLFLAYFQLASGWNPVLELFYRAMGYGFALSTLGTLVWIFAFSERRIQRMWAALLVVYFAAGAIFVLSGRLF